MKIDLSGKSAIITGSTEGIGYAIAVGLSESGARVVINGRTQAKVDEALAGLRNKVPAAKAQGFAGDLSSAAGCAALLGAFPQTDILVNNLGIYEVKPFFEITDEDWERFFQVNVMSGVRLTRGYMKSMLERNWGRIIFLSSESGVNLPDDMLHYGFTKTAVLALSRGLAKLARGTGVTVNAVLPGPTMSAGVERMLQGAAQKSGKTIEQVGAEFVKTKRATSIIQRVASAEEVANMVVYACSPQASATTGAALRVEGGIVETVA
ncbi:MAG: SDR family NAD(P)-dependent oxidoreductase [Methylobacteriaceae bacterium]|nr:SDR family NAD(P)-dependent oxidoreductase [Methylobacteriaceae bacterium]